MLSIKVEPEDTPTWEERSYGTIMKNRHAAISEDAGNCVTATAELVSSFVEGRDEDGCRKEEAKNPSQESGNASVTVQVAVHMEENEFLAEKEENEIAIIAREDDSDLEDEGGEESAILQVYDPQMQQSSGTPSMSLAGTSSSDINTGTYSSSSDLNVNEDICLEVNNSLQRLEGLTSERQRDIFCKLPSTGLQATKQLVLAIRQYQHHLSKNSGSKLDESESIYSHVKSLKRKGEKSGSHKKTCGPHDIIDTDNKGFTCQFCGKLFTQKRNCKRHEMIHTGENPFNCKFCGKPFSRRENCNTHEMSHTGEKPFKCQFCEKVFSRKADCKMHEMTHTGEKPFKCQYCEKPFIRKGDCRTHEMTHTGVKPFKCQFCEKSFFRKHHRRKHEVNTHSADRQLKSECSKESLSEKSDCKTHEGMLTGEQTFKCKVCQKSFVQEQDYEKHEMTHTHEEPSISFVRNHQMDERGEKPIECQYGEKPFECQYGEKPI